jgi:hypothetical protein
MKSKNEAPKKSSARNNVLLILGALVLMSGIVWISMESNRRPSPSAVQPEQPPMVATLSPDLFTGKARDAYEAAKEIPEILRYMPCFCGCFGMGHRNNLYCFADNHGDECDMCQDIALEAQRMNKEGLSIEKIGEAIRARYSPAK